MSKAIELKASDVNPQGGIFCPNKLSGMELWNAHPKVFLAIGHTGEARCPYCGTHYKLKAGEQLHGH